MKTSQGSFDTLVKKSTRVALSDADKALPRGIEPPLTADAALLDADFT